MNAVQEPKKDKNQRPKLSHFFDYSDPWWPLKNFIF